MCVSRLLARPVCHVRVRCRPPDYGEERQRIHIREDRHYLVRRDGIDNDIHVCTACESNTVVGQGEPTNITAQFAVFFYDGTTVYFPRAIDSSVEPHGNLSLSYYCRGNKIYRAIADHRPHSRRPLVVILNSRNASCSIKHKQPKEGTVLFKRRRMNSNWLCLLTTVA